MRTRSKALPFGVIFAAVMLPVLALASAPPAKTILSDASAKALKEKKNVMVVFHASWCGWCKKYDAMLESKEFKSIFEKSYVITHVDVLENAGPHKADENEGGVDLMNQLGAKADSGIPFFAVLNPQGSKLGDSILPTGANIGYPGEPQEIDAYMVLIKKTAPQMSKADIAKIEAFLRKNGTAAATQGAASQPAQVIIHP